MSADDALHRLAALAGVARDYRDAYGRMMPTSDDTLRAVLGGLGLPAATGGDVAASTERLSAQRRALIAPLLPAAADAPLRLAISDPPSGELVWRLTLEDGAARGGRSEIGANDGQPFVELPRVPAGYHRLHVASGWKRAEALVIAAPPRCYLPVELDDGGRGFGLTTQLYGLRSARNFGFGDFGDVERLVDGSAALGGAFLGLSPLHALFVADRTKISPYSPASRLFVDPLFIDPQRMTGFAASGAAVYLTDPEVANRLAALRTGAFVDHAAAWALKREVLERIWRHVQDRPAPEFAAFRRERDPQLKLHATFESLSVKFGAEGRNWLGEWPDAFRDVNNPAIAAYQSEAADDIAFYEWLQWVADTQLAEAQAHALAQGMSVGLYRDLAVGSDLAGAEVWANPERFARDLAIGAPPDPLGPLGQDWGLPPFNPLVLETEGAAAFRMLVKDNMRHAGAIRIDHAFQLQRLFLIPRGSTAAQGAYVDYPFAAQLAILKLESHRARALVIAEDLGNAPEGFSDAIMQAGLLSYRILPFERMADGAFKPPAAYPRDALVAMTTHDLATFAGWWQGLDVDLRETFAIYDQPTAAAEREQRRDEVRQFAEALREQNLVAATDITPEPPFEPALRFIARTDSVLAAIQIEDIIGELNQANLPGPDLGHPNWRRRLGTDLDTILAPGGPLRKLVAVFASEGRRLAPVAARLTQPPPRGTYRLQFHKGFTFDDAAKIVPYLARLGVSHVYASPIQKARPGSTHGYDCVDPAELNPELGGAAGFARLSEALKAQGLELLLDIVPNHMGVGGADNGWWLSLLEWGRRSPYADTFDVDWERLGAAHKLVAPFLGGHYGEVLEKGDLKLAFDAEDGSFSVWHFEHRFPICPLSYCDVLDRAGAAEIDSDGRGVGVVLRISEELRALAETPDAPGVVEACEQIKRRLARVARRPDTGEAIARAVRLLNGSPGRPERFGALHRLLERQSYRLAYWRVAASDVNYRRFFDIDTLAGLRIETPEVFERVHRLIVDLVQQGHVQGLRIDHIDGLADPRAYAEQLQHAVGPGFYIVAEKILEPGEALRPWPLAGTTGYDVLNLIDGVLVDPAAEAALEARYRKVGGFTGTYGAALREAKRHIIRVSFASELESLVSDLKRIADADRCTRDYTANAIREALGDLLTAFPIYRTYIRDVPVEDDRSLVGAVVAEAKRISALPDRSVHDFAGAALLGDLEIDVAGAAPRDMVARFRRRFQQLSGPVMAKSLEDTLFYRYVRFLALNEVGGAPDHFGVSVAAFHAENVARAAAWPNALIATSTHDTKRGEDARGRLIALSEAPALWDAALEVWGAAVGSVEAPDANDRYLLLQALIGAWPLALLEADDPATLADLKDRLGAFVIKAFREAKRHSRWIEPDEPYEGAAQALLDRLLVPGADFLARMRPLLADLSLRGMLNGLTRTILKCTLPGVPDLYQGDEFWDYALVDPDNRRPVDYEARRRALDSSEPLPKLLAHWPDGAIKQRIIHLLLADRTAHPAFYAQAGYEPVMAAGALADRVIAFQRHDKEGGLVVAVPRLANAARATAAIPCGTAFWGDTTLSLPAGRWRAILPDDGGMQEGTVTLATLFASVPFAVLRREP
jgi:(1->4)-alpha-D-glucan 1-alpha-D-glucosylmutase